MIAFAAPVDCALFVCTIDKKTKKITTSDHVIIGFSVEKDGVAKPITLYGVPKFPATIGGKAILLESCVVDMSDGKTYSTDDDWIDAVYKRVVGKARPARKEVVVNKKPDEPTEFAKERLEEARAGDLNVAAQIATIAEKNGDTALAEEMAAIIDAAPMPETASIAASNARTTASNDAVVETEIRRGSESKDEVAEARANMQKLVESGAVIPAATDKTKTVRRLASAPGKKETAKKVASRIASLI